jgi:DNA-binding transcriptional LysR family regulator
VCITVILCKFQALFPAETRGRRAGGRDGLKEWGSRGPRRPRRARRFHCSNHRAARQAIVRLEDLAPAFFPGISAETFPGASRHVTAACARAGFRPKILQMVERGYTILGLVAGNCGVALLPESLKALPHPGIVFRPLADPPVADLFLAWRAKSIQPVLKEFLTHS